MTEIETIPGVPVSITNSVHIAWDGEHRFDAARPGGPAIRIDASGRTGPGPVDTLLIALGTCTAIDIIDILAKRRTPVESMRIDVLGPRADAVPRRVVGVLLTFHITGATVEREHAERAAELSVAKYCSVRDSLDPEMPVRWKVVLNGSPD